MEYSQQWQQACVAACTTAGRSRRSARRQLTPAYLPESGRDVPEAFEATGTSSNAAFAASGSDAAVVETVPLPPAQERQAAFGRCYECCTVVRDPATCTSMDGPCCMVQRSMLHACCTGSLIVRRVVSGLCAPYASGMYCLYVVHGAWHVACDCEAAVPTAHSCRASASL